MTERPHGWEATTVAFFKIKVILLNIWRALIEYQFGSVAVGRSTILVLCHIQLNLIDKFFYDVFISVFNKFIIARW